MARAPRSVSRRLLIAVTVPLLLFFVLVAVALDAVFRHLSAQQLRQQLDDQEVALIGEVDLDAKGDIVVEPLDPELHLQLPGSGQYAALRDERGRLLWRSPSLVGTGLVLGDDIATGLEKVRYLRARDGTQVAELSERLQWQIGTGPTRVARRLIFSVADSTVSQTRQLQTFRQQMAAWFGGLALALLATMAWMMRRALAPVRRLEHEIAAVEAGEATLLGEGYPRELAGVAHGLNALLESERNRIRRYRDTLGNLAHALKTPLAVIRTSLGAADAAAAIQLEVDRMAQIVEHQLKRAAAGGGVSLGQAPVAILPLVTELRVALLKVHARKDLRIEVDVPATVGFLGDRGDILELLGNLLDNACKWCRSHVAVSARLDPGRAPGRRLSIVVEDDGPGIAPADRRRVMERGVRASEHVPGHGLGLSIVRETVALYGGEFFIDASVGLGGARLELQVPGR
ncbi:MAG TPA: ATP-binding protein [Steroidobacteraceae bacterium]|nr:ATP-binding protein [Steroidobacteraceae bacterium]